MWARSSSTINVTKSVFLQAARAHELEGVCVTEVWQHFFDQLEAQIEFRREFPHIRDAR